MKKEKVVVILGPTASGKSALAVTLAQKFNGEVISADSRQVYKGLDIGTGKITKKEMMGIPHHLLDVASPKERFTVEEFKNLGQKTVAEIISRKKLPIICGGTGFYIQVLVDNISFPEVAPNIKLRKQLEQKECGTLLIMLKKLDPKRAKDIDPKNKRRIIRAIEIAKALGKVPKTKSKPLYTPLFVGIETENGKLKNNIHTRLLARMKQGMLAEAKKLHIAGLSFKRMEELGLEYRYMSRHLQGKITKQEMLTELEREIWAYARRQMTWFKRDKRIMWFGVKEVKKIEGEIKRFFQAQ